MLPTHRPPSPSKEEREEKSILKVRCQKVNSGWPFESVLFYYPRPPQGRKTGGSRVLGLVCAVTGLIIHRGSSAVGQRVRGGETHRVLTESVPTLCPSARMLSDHTEHINQTPCARCLSVIYPCFAQLLFLPVRRR